MAKKGSDNVLLTIAIVAVVVAAISLYASYSSLYALSSIMLEPETGSVDVDIVEDLNIVLTTNSIDWGDGYVDAASFNSAELDTEGTVTGGAILNDWDTVNEGFVVENAGNVDVCIDVKTNNDAASFIGGSVVSPEYQFKVTNCNTADCSYTTRVDPGDVDDTAASCAGAWYTSNGGSYVDVSTTNLRVCDSFDNVPVSDEFRVDVRVVIPSDAPLSENSDTMTVTATGLALC